MAFSDNYSSGALTELNEIKTLAGKQNTAVISKYLTELGNSVDVIMNGEDSDARTIRYSHRLNKLVRRRNGIYKYLLKFEDGASIAQPFFELFSDASYPEVTQTLKSVRAPIDVIQSKYLTLKYDTNAYASYVYGNTTAKTGDQAIKQEIVDFKNYFFT